MDTQDQFVEDMGMYFERIGLARMAGRIVGWLLVCTPPQQSMPQVGDALHASKSSISTGLWQLRQTGLVDRVRVPGDRKDYFRLNADIWTHTFGARLQLVRELRHLAERGLLLLAGEPAAARQRLAMMRDLNAFMEDELPKLLQRWDEVKQAKGYED